ncbi:transmembrane protein, putative [Medicago truncatula]|uniref:Transmembrane protein, putative n=1 Tax=Medicago truncatula TaxID=3880 RepID=G7K7L6_MEDTR|nr:transmembrane protein, putative [Medicago truncatula]
MSFLAGRLAGKEAAYFFQESKQAVTKLAQKNNPISKTNVVDQRHVVQDNADVLPEVLRHSLPSKLFRDETASSSSFSASKWVLQSDPKLRSSVSPDAINPLRAFVSLPQVTFGARRWELPEAKHGVSASTANELRQDRYDVNVNPEKLKAASEGLANLGKAFAIATAVVFGGAAMVIGMVASKLELHNMGDLKTKGKDVVEPQLENIKNYFVPMKAENMSRKWHLEREDVKQKAIVKDLSKILGSK